MPRPDAKDCGVVMGGISFNSFSSEGRPVQSSAHYPESLANRLQRFLPLRAYGRPPLIGMLRRHSPYTTASSRLLVMNVFDAGEQSGLMCKVHLASGASASSVLVVPVTLLAFDRRHPISREVAEYRRRRAELTEKAGAR
jgi:hypothetical protein